MSYAGIVQAIPGEGGTQPAGTSLVLLGVLAILLGLLNWRVFRNRPPSSQQPETASEPSEHSSDT